MEFNPKLKLFTFSEPIQVFMNLLYLLIISIFIDYLKMMLIK